MREREGREGGREKQTQYCKCIIKVVVMSLRENRGLYLDQAAMSIKTRL